MGAGPGAVTASAWVRGLVARGLRPEGLDCLRLGIG